MSEITLTPESFRTSQISPLVLSEKQRVQVVFDAKQVDNIHDFVQRRLIPKHDT